MQCRPIIVPRVLLLNFFTSRHVIAKLAELDKKS